MELHIVLHEPEIPQNTGSIGRTCMAIGARLHLVEPLGFSLDNKYLKRAGLDYWHELDLEIHPDWSAFRSAYPNAPLWFFTTKAGKSCSDADWEQNPFLVFGKETAGLPLALLQQQPERCLRIPMLPRARSLNLSVAAGIAAYEAMRHYGFPKLAVAALGKTSASLTACCL